MALDRVDPRCTCRIAPRAQDAATSAKIGTCGSSADFGVPVDDLVIGRGVCVQPEGYPPTTEQILALLIAEESNNYMLR